MKAVSCKICILYNRSIYLTIIFQCNNIAFVFQSATLASYMYIVGGYRHSFKLGEYTCDIIGMKQKLSPKAAAAKKARDLATAKTARRTKMKAENQRKRRAAIKAGKNINGKDYDHNRGEFVSIKTNRSKTKTSNNTLKKKK